MRSEAHLRVVRERLRLAYPRDYADRFFRKTTRTARIVGAEPEPTK